MFVDKLKEEEIIPMGKKYLSMVVGVLNANEYMKNSSLSTYAGYARLDFIDDELCDEFVEITDFEAIVSTAIRPYQELINKEHRKNMYRKFGKEYLDELDKFGKGPIQEEYDRKMLQHNLMMKEIER